MKKMLLAALTVGAFAFNPNADATPLNRIVVESSTLQSEIERSMIELDMWSHLKHKIFGGKRKDDDDYRRQPPPPPPPPPPQYDHRHQPAPYDRGHTPPPPPPPPRR